MSVTIGKDIIKTQFIFQQVSIANMTEVQATQHFQWCDFVMRLKSQPVACPKDFSSVGWKWKHVTKFTGFISARKLRVQSMHLRLQTSQYRLVKRSTERRSNEMADSLIQMSLLFFCLALLRRFISLWQQHRETVYPRSQSINLLQHWTPFYPRYWIQHEFVTTQDTILPIQVMGQRKIHKSK